MPLNLETDSLARSLASLPESERQKIIDELSPEEFAALEYDWKFWARPKQLAPPGDWKVWLIMAGRGFGKTRCGAEWVRENVETGKFKRIALIAPTAADLREVMVEGESGICNISPPWFTPTYQPSKRRIVWPNGAMASLFSAEEPDRLRGPQHDAAWIDELCAWRAPESYDMLMLGLRLGEHPQCLITTTPKPTPLLRSIAKDENTVKSVGTTYENRENLAPSFFTQVISLYENTRLGRQELLAEILEDNPNALWNHENIEKNRTTAKDVPPLKRIVVGVDPQGKNKKDGAETGIITAGIDAEGQGYILDDDSLKALPDIWGRAVVNAYYEHEADKVIGETNNGGDMVGHTIHTVDANIPFESVTATRGSTIRAEPISALYEQNKIHHVGHFPILEEQMCEWDPNIPKGQQKSPDRMDGLVWAVTDLYFGERAKKVFFDVW